MANRKIEDIKHGVRVVDLLSDLGWASFGELESASHLDRKTLQNTLNRLQKFGFAMKTDRGWVRV